MFFSRILRSEALVYNWFFFLEQAFYGNNWALDYHTNTVISQAYLLVKMASRTVTRPIKATFGELIFIVYFNNLFILHQMPEGKTEKWIYSMRIESAMPAVLVFINDVQLGPCGFRPFDFHSILKIENQNFTIVFFNVWFLKNLQSQFSLFVAKKGKIKHHSSIFWKSKTKNWKWPVSRFNFLFSISSFQDSSY